MSLLPHKFGEGSPESVQATVKELEENLKEGIATAVGSSLTKLSQAKVVGIACDVCEPHDVQRLANFAVSELGHIDIWVSTVIILAVENLSFTNQD